MWNGVKLDGKKPIEIATGERQLRLLGELREGDYVVYKSTCQD